MADRIKVGQQAELQFPPGFRFRYLVTVVDFYEFPTPSGKKLYAWVQLEKVLSDKLTGEKRNFAESFVGLLGVPIIALKPL
ncbi:MAG TPA: hypothetical protein VI643_02465 [Planctomycetota bacterium]|nr:hypothetical protein [Planctomycetota bacterium]